MEKLKPGKVQKKKINIMLLFHVKMYKKYLFMLIFSDTDENDKITYNFISDWGLDTFSIDPTSGIITLSGSSLDHESIEHYILTVSASGIITVFLMIF